MQCYLADVLQDTRFAARTLARSPGFVFAAAVCLAIGIGLTAAIYTQVRSTVLKELPGTRAPRELVRLQRPAPLSDYEEFRDRSGQFASVAAYMAPVPLVVSRQGSEPQRVWGHIATPDYFDVLGATAAVGRLFGPGDGPVAVLSDRLWKARFGGDRSIAGRAIRINGQPVTVIGIASPGFLGASPMNAAADVWIPTTAPDSLAPELTEVKNRRIAAFEVIGRLKAEVTEARAESALEALVRRLEQIHNDPGRDSKERRIRLVPGGRMFPVRDEDLPRLLGFPLLLVSLVLLMGCVNVANMLLARAAARTREISLRQALGAGRGRIVRQLLTESLMLAGLGGVGGLVFAFWYLRLVESLRPIMPGYTYFELHFDWRSLLYAALLAAGSGVLFGLVPALRASRADVYAGLKSPAPRLRARRWFSARNVLVLQQVAASMVLLLLTGFIVVGFQRNATTDVGFETANLYLVGVDPVRDGYSPARAREFFDTASRRLAGVPGVLGVSVAQTLPPAMTGGDAMMSARNEFVSGGRRLGAARADRVGAGFFETAGIPVLRGRGFTERDQSDDARVLLVNETLVRQAWPGEEPVGRALDLDGRTWEVIGVARDIRSSHPLLPAQAAAYRPVTPSGFASPSRNGVTLVVRVAPGFDAATRLRREIEAIDSNVTVFNVKHMADEVQQMMYLVRFGVFLYGGMGVFGLVLAAVGLAGVTAYAVARRTHEIGIRVALGARRGAVLALVLREASAIIVVGTVVGLALALAATRALGALLETMAEATRTSASDPALLVGAPALLAALALAACYLPARRSMRINPVDALRAE